MERLSWIGKIFRFIYTNFFLRFSGQIRDPYLIRVDKIDTDIETNELMVSFHVANKRISENSTVAQFVKANMIYLVDPKVVFEMGTQFGAHSEKLLTTQKANLPFKKKCAISLKRVFVDG